MEIERNRCDKNVTRITKTAFCNDAHSLWMWLNGFDWHIPWQIWCIRFYLNQIEIGTFINILYVELNQNVTASESIVLDIDSAFTIG